MRMSILEFAPRQGIGCAELNKLLGRRSFRRVRVRLENVIRFGSCLWMVQNLYSRKYSCSSILWFLNQETGCAWWKWSLYLFAVIEIAAIKVTFFRSSSAGTWLFDQRRWLDPTDSSDCNLLHSVSEMRQWKFAWIPLHKAWIYLLRLQDSAC